MEDEIKQSIKIILSNILEISDKNINDEDDFLQDLGIDSMMAIEIIASLEEKYKIALDDLDFVKFTTVEETSKAISKILKK